MVQLVTLSHPQSIEEVQSQQNKVQIQNSRAFPCRIESGFNILFKSSVKEFHSNIRNQTYIILKVQTKYKVYFTLSSEMGHVAEM